MKRRQRKILVIDDDPTLLPVLEKRLTVDGYKVIGTLAGESGVKRAIEESPDLILCDLMIPDISGVEVTRKLRAHEQTKKIPIIFMTAYMGVENDKGNEELEIDGDLFRTFAKPLHTPKLLSVIRKTLNKLENEAR